MFGGRCRCNYLQILRKVEAAGIEPGHFDDLGAVSPRHLAQVRDPPREMGGPRALSRVANRHPAGSVDQRDHKQLSLTSDNCEVERGVQVPLLVMIALHVASMLLVSALTR